MLLYTDVLNTQVSESTKTTAYEIVFGQKLNNLSGICKKDEDLEESELQDLFLKLADKMYVTTKTEINKNSTSTPEQPDSNEDVTSGSNDSQLKRSVVCDKDEPVKSPSCMRIDFPEKRIGSTRDYVELHQASEDYPTIDNSTFLSLLSDHSSKHSPTYSAADALTDTINPVAYSSADTTYSGVCALTDATSYAAHVSTDVTRDDEELYQAIEDSSTVDISTFLSLMSDDSLKHSPTYSAADALTDTINPAAYSSADTTYSGVCALTDTINPATYSSAADTTNSATHASADTTYSAVCALTDAANYAAHTSTDGTKSLANTQTDVTASAAHTSVNGTDSAVYT